jgi:hypothetical protein
VNPDLPVQDWFRRQREEERREQRALGRADTGTTSVTTAWNAAGDLPWLPVWNIPARSKAAVVSPIVAAEICPRTAISVKPGKLRCTGHAW